ncbi:hypothetical protein [Kineosporia succinea]
MSPRPASKVETAAPTPPNTALTPIICTAPRDSTSLPVSVTLAAMNTPSSPATTRPAVARELSAGTGA